MTAVRARAIEAIRLALEPVAALVEVMPSGDPDRWPALAIYDTGQSPTETEPGADRDEIEIVVEGYVETVTGTAYADINELHAATVRAMFADETFGGLVEVLTKQDMQLLVAELASKRRLAFVQRFSAQIVTRRGDPSQPA